MTDRASLTAEYMALFRALESLRPASSRLFFDPIARLFLHGWRRWAYRVARCGARTVIERLIDWRSPGARAAGIARTSWIDDEVTSSLAASSQLVLLGAGFDTRAQRLAACQRATVFELDHPGTSLTKQARLRNRPESPVGRLHLAVIDFGAESIGDVLRRSGFDETRPACFVWEGVTNYLSSEAVDRVIQQIGRGPAGNTLLFTYIDRAVLDQPARFLGAQRLLSRLQAYGEPWTFGFRPEAVESYLAQWNLRLLQDVSVAEVWERTGRPQYQVRGYEFYRLACARVERICARSESVRS